MLDQDPDFLERQFQRKKVAPFAPVILARIFPVSWRSRSRKKNLFIRGLSSSRDLSVFILLSAGAHVLGYVGKIDEDEIEDNQQYGYTPLSFVGKTGD